MTTIAQARTSLAAAVTTTGLRCIAYLSDQIPAPCALISRKEFDPRMVFGGSKSTYGFRVTIYTSRPAERASQVLIDGYCETTGATSLVAAIANGANWTATVDYAEVVRVGEIMVHEIAGVPYLVAELDVEVVW